MKKHMNRAKGLLGALGLVSLLGAAAPVTATQDGMIGEIRFFGGNFAPRTWALCDGQLISISSNTALFSILGTTYGGDGRSTFGLPDMRGRSPVHAGFGPGLAGVALGQKGGATSFTLTEANLPAHSHSASTTTTTDTTTDTTTTSTLHANSGAGANNSPEGDVLANDGRDRIYNSAAPNVAMHADAVQSSSVSTSTSTSSSTTTIGNTGGNQAVVHRSPYIGVNCIICISGVFPSRS